MRNVRDVYRKLREVKHAHLVILYKKYFRKIPENCRYSCPYKFRAEDGKDYEIRLCMLHQDELDLSKGIYPHLVDVCRTDDQSHKCNAFTPRYTKEDVQAIFREELDNHKVKVKKYPDICALEWVLERSVAGVPPFNLPLRAWFAIKHFLVRNKLL